MKTRTSVGWVAVTAMVAVVSACGGSTSSDFADGGGRDAGTSSGGSSGSGSGGCQRAGLQPNIVDWFDLNGGCTVPTPAQ
jgi:hypothetical protein